MNVDFVALGGTAWTIGGAMIVACMGSTHQNFYTFADGFLQMVLQESEWLFFRN